MFLEIAHSTFWNVEWNKIQTTEKCILKIKRIPWNGMNPLYIISFSSPLETGTRNVQVINVAEKLFLGCLNKEAD